MGKGGEEGRGILGAGRHMSEGLGRADPKVLLGAPRGCPGSVLGA